MRGKIMKGPSRNGAFRGNSFLRRCNRRALYLISRPMNCTTELESKKGRSLAFFFLAVAALLILLPGNNLIPLIDRDEPRFAQATREMMQRHEWVVPYFNNDYRFDKPVLIYWMMRPVYRILGCNEFAARLPSVLSTILLLWIVLKMGRRWFSLRTGFFAAFGLLTCFQMLMHGRSAVADMPMIAMTALAQYAAFELLHSEGEKYPWGWFWLLYLACGIGFLAKGPVVMIVPLLSFLTLRWILWRKKMPWRRLRIGLGLPISLALIGAWGIPALVKTHGEYWTVGMYTHVFERGWDTFDGHAAFFLYYVVIAIVSLFPWIALAGDGIAVLRRNWSEKNAFLVAWLVSTYVLFSFYMTKLPHYVMPAFPALFLILGQTAEPGFVSPKWGRIWFRLVIGLGLVVGLGALVFASATHFTAPYAGLRTAIFGGATVTLSLAALALFWRLGAFRFSVAPLVVLAFGVVLLGRGLRESTPAIHLSPVINQLPAGSEFGFYRYKEPSLVFYTNHRWEPLGSFDDAQGFINKPGPRVLIVLEQEVGLQDYLRTLGARLRGRDVPLRVRDYTDEVARLNTVGYESMSFEGLNIAHTAATKVRMFYRP